MVVLLDRSIQIPSQVSRVLTRVDSLVPPTMESPWSIKLRISLILLWSQVILYSSSVPGFILGAPTHEHHPHSDQQLETDLVIPSAWNSSFCPSYAQFIATPSTTLHESTMIPVPNRRPDRICRTFNSSTLEFLLSKFEPHLKDPRDATNQVMVYIPLIAHDPPLRKLILGIINLQAQFITQSTYCNGFHPSSVNRTKLEPPNGSSDFSPAWVASTCQSQVDGLASFLLLSNQFYRSTNQTDFMTPTWLKAVELILQVFEYQSRSNPKLSTGPQEDPYIQYFHHEASKPPSFYTGLVATDKRPSNESVTFPYNVPVNVMISTQTSQLEKLLLAASPSNYVLARRAATISRNIDRALSVHATIDHPTWGRVYAYELDGYGSHTIMDDAVVPSLLSLPYLGWTYLNSTVYRSTRRMLTSSQGNPYFFNGTQGFGIGSSHTGPSQIWPMSLISMLLTSENDQEIESILRILVDSTQGYGVLHQSFDASKPEVFTRTWFAWVNSYFAEAILYLAQSKPHLIFKDARPILISSQGNLAYYRNLKV